MDKHVVRTADGSVDVTASMEAYGTALREWSARNEVPSETIEMAVEAVFDKHPQGLSVPALVHFAVSELSSDASQFKALQVRVHGYVTGQSAQNTGRLHIAKGKNGGAKRLARPGELIPAREEKAKAGKKSA